MVVDKYHFLMLIASRIKLQTFSRCFKADGILLIINKTDSADNKTDATN